jgi:DNA polymerase
LLAAAVKSAAMLDPAQRTDILALLAWYREMGVDVAVAESPTDWLAKGDIAPGAHLSFAKAEAIDATLSAPVERTPVQIRTEAVPRTSAAPASRQSVPVAPRQFPTASPDTATMAARQAARSAGSLEALHESLKQFDGCGLKATAKNLCFYRGAPGARLMIIGEAPGREEELEGKPFVGRAGQLLDKMLAAIGLTEADVHITNIVYWRPPGNRTPTPQEAQVCRPFLERPLELVSPEIVLTLGGPATAAILDVQGGIMKARGRWCEVTIGEYSVRAMPTLHPAYLLRTPAAKRLTWRDLLAVKIALLEGKPAA